MDFIRDVPSFVRLLLYAFILAGLLIGLNGLVGYVAGRIRRKNDGRIDRQE